MPRTAELSIMARQGRGQPDEDGGCVPSGLSTRLGGVEALALLGLGVEVGEAHGVLGPNGAGKTTAIRLVLDHLLARPVARLPWLVGHCAMSAAVLAGLGVVGGLSGTGCVAPASLVCAR